ncbi:MAG: DUF4249 domain-containing protein [Flavobacterium sp.]|nr:MAG: DUF4249 domain-containing protein [Flavobacterium sp.]
MKKINYILLTLIAMLAVSCQDVVDVDLDTAAPRLVIDASIDWLKGTDGSQQRVKLTTTTGYYSTEIPAVSGATVFVTNSADMVFEFIEDEGTGIYYCSNFIPVIDETYRLTVISGGQTYIATERLYAVPDIGEITQDNEGGFFNEDVELRYDFQDPAGIANWYMFRIDVPYLAYGDYNVSDDKFSDGNLTPVIFYDDELKQGDVVTFRQYGISQRYYNYMNILISMATGGSGGGPFQSPPATLRGNVVNQTNESNYALGYFRASEVDTIQYTVTE